MEDHLQLLSGAICVFAYGIIGRSILTSSAEQSFAAFLLWALLDGIAAITSAMAGGNYWLALANALGSGSVALLLIVKRQISWSLIESFTALLVAICLATWYVAGGRAAILASSIAVVMASIPQMVETYKKPAATPLIAYLVFLAANGLSLTAGKAWTLAERFYPSCSLFLTIVIVAFCGRRWVRR